MNKVVKQFLKLTKNSTDNFSMSFWNRVVIYIYFLLLLCTMAINVDH